MLTLTLKRPLRVDWTQQYVRLNLKGKTPGDPLLLAVDGAPAFFQYTGKLSDEGAEILVRTGFEHNVNLHKLVFSDAQVQESGLERRSIPLGNEVTTIGIPGSELRVSAAMPFAGFADSPMKSVVRCEAGLERASLEIVNDGPLFSDYELACFYAGNRYYILSFRCYKHDSFIEVSETFRLGMNAELVWLLNPEKKWTHIISRDSFENETQPVIEPLGVKRRDDILCRLQMPALSEYFVPVNRGWFSFFDEREPAAGMTGIMGLYGAKWEEPAANMPEITDCAGLVEWRAPLAGGKRYWLLYKGDFEKGFQMPNISDGRPDSRFVFHRLHAEFNALRLDEHLDLTEDILFDDSIFKEPCVFESGDFHAAARERFELYPCLQNVLEKPDYWLKHNGDMHLASFRYLLNPTHEHAEELFGCLVGRFEKWVRQFQGYRTGQSDYLKNVIGFSRHLRGMLVAYEQLRRDGILDKGRLSMLNAYFVFAARRILDEGRWPRSRTWKHPDHPDSVRDFYTYTGEHKPDRLIWTNSLPNFQSDPVCALAHLSAIFKNHPAARDWKRIAVEEIDRQLDAYCGPSGAWEESINYALYTFSYFVITFKALKERWGIDYFSDKRVRRLVAWFCRFFGPRDRRFDSYTWPAIGNAVLPQNQAEYLLCYAAELERNDPLREACLAIWQRVADRATPSEHYPVVMAAMAPLERLNKTDKSGESETKLIPLRALESELMDEVGVAMRHRHTEPDESYLFQKIGFAKDHYETDESALNWYAKGAPLCMDYGTYTPDVSVGGAHNLIEIPDMDPLRRGWLADHLFTEPVDYTRCEIPVTLKLLWGRIRDFAEIDKQDGRAGREETPSFYVGEKTPVGPKTWKVRQLLFVKPDYIVLFDRVYGHVAHRYNMHVTGSDIQREGPYIRARGRFGVDLLAYVHQPAEFEFETGELVPRVHPACGGEEARARHAQHYFRLYNHVGAIYRTLLFAVKGENKPEITPVGVNGIQVITKQYTDYVFLNNDFIAERTDNVEFRGRAGWIRRYIDGRIQSCLPDGELIEAFL